MAICVNRLLLLILIISPVAGQLVPQALKGRILLSDKRFPTTVKNTAAYTAALTKQSKVTFAEDKESKRWRIFYAAFLRLPLSGNQYRIQIYDESGKGKQLLLTIDGFADSRGQETVFSEIILERNRVGVNKTLLLTLESADRKVLASAQFKILGEAAKNSGKVEFKEE